MRTGVELPYLGFVWAGLDERATPARGFWKIGAGSFVVEEGETAGPFRGHSSFGGEFEIACGKTSEFKIYEKFKNFTLLI